MTVRVLRQVRMNKKIKKEFTVQASAMDVELSVLHDMAIMDFVQETEASSEAPVFLQQPKITSAITCNIRLSTSVLDSIEKLATNDENNSVSVPAAIYTGLIRWARKHDFKTE